MIDPGGGVHLARFVTGTSSLEDPPDPRAAESDGCNSF
jgi:hypothetical protein